MFPELFRIGSFPVHTYGVLMALAFLAALLIASRLGQRDGLPKERVYDLGLWMLLAGLLGSKILMLWTEPDYTNWRSFFSLDFLRSGGVWYGGFIGGVVAGFFLMRYFKLPWWKTADAFAPGIALGQAIGRQGCFAAGCCWGKPSDLPWACSFTERAHELTGVPFGIHLHPTQLYESIAMLIVFAFLFFLHRKKKFSGQVVLTYGVLYSVVRFTIEFWRDDPRGDVAGLTTLTGLSTSQMISLLIFALSVTALITRWQRNDSPDRPLQSQSNKFHST
jgi:phosphatidylglycerol:prolipoprotein diacylglycerol transferase